MKKLDKKTNLPFFSHIQYILTLSPTARAVVVKKRVERLWVEAGTGDSHATQVLERARGNVDMHLKKL